MKAGIYSATGATDHLKLPSLQGLGPSSSAQCTLHNVHIQVCKYTRILHYSSIQHTLYIETYTVAHSSSHMYTSLYTAHCTVHSFFWPAITVRALQTLHCIILHRAHCTQCTKSTLIISTVPTATLQHCNTAHTALHISHIATNYVELWQLKPSTATELCQCAHCTHCSLNTLCTLPGRQCGHCAQCNTAAELCQCAPCVHCTQAASTLQQEEAAQLEPSIHPPLINQNQPTIIFDHLHFSYFYIDQKIKWN